MKEIFYLILNLYKISHNEGACHETRSPVKGVASRRLVYKFSYYVYQGDGGCLKTISEIKMFQEERSGG